MPVHFSSLHLPSITLPSFDDIRSKFSAFTGKISSALQSIGRRTPEAVQPLQNRQVETVSAPMQAPIQQLRASSSADAPQVKQRLLAQRERFEPKVISNSVKLSDLPPAVTGSKKFKELIGGFAEILSRGGTLASKQKILEQELAPKLNQLLDSADIPYATKLALTLSDGREFMDSLRNEIMKTAPASSRASIGNTLDQLTKNGQWERLYDRAMINVGDKAEGSRSPANGPKKITVDGTEYVYARDLGSGQFGGAQLFIDSKNPQNPGVVVKVPQPSESNHGRKVLIQDPASEGRALVNAFGTGASADHVVPFKAAIRSPGGELLLVLGMAKHGSFESALEKIDEAVDDHVIDASTAAQLKLTPMVDLARALERLQLAKGQVHFDVATRNLLINDKGIGQLADFGLAENVDGDVIEGAKANPGDKPVAIRWTAPERLRNEPSTPKADTWMFGMTLWETVFGRLPLRDIPTNTDVVQKIASGNFDPTIDLPVISPDDWPDGLDVQLRDLFEKVLQHDPAARPSMDEVLRHPALNFGITGTPAAQQQLAAVLSRSDAEQPIVQNAAPGAVAYGAYGQVIPVTNNQGAFGGPYGTPIRADDVPDGLSYNLQPDSEAPFYANVPEDEDARSSRSSLPTVPETDTRDDNAPPERDGPAATYGHSPL